MQLHLVGGFLGSGKTTAIAQAADFLIGRGLRVGIVTNEQGRHLVDTALFQNRTLPAMEVTGGCICCHLDDFAERIDEMVAQFNPQVIFAESVGSCTDLVATVIKPLQELRKYYGSPASLSVFADARLLLRFLRGMEMPFSECVVFIYASQLEEAGLIVINKADLLDACKREEAIRLAHQAYSNKQFRLQNSLDRSQVAEWLELISSEEYPLPQVSLDLDYGRYAEGEGRFAWVDRELDIHMTESVDPAVIGDFIKKLSHNVACLETSVAHLKCLVSDGQHAIKLSLTSLDDDPSKFNLHPAQISLLGKDLTIIINAMVEGDLQLVENCIDDTWKDLTAVGGLEVSTRAAFTRIPGYPKPTMRLGNQI